ncbi:MAG: pantetheine-phosphate adenylyltransferase [Ruminococcaceae bacterium]|nr:pantetheine-phosphate adenylyltransferase [Oscillospiraceae bacterium]
MKNSTVIYPGSFDPITYGHLDIIKRAAAMFDKLIVVVMTNSKKSCSFTPEERREMILKSVKDLPNVEVDFYDGLLAEYAKIKNASAIIKGLRAMSDFEYEFQMALTNKKLNPEVETLFLTTSTQYMYLSSSMVKQIVSMNGDISDFVPKEIHEDIVERLGGQG